MAFTDIDSFFCSFEHWFSWRKEMFQSTLNISIIYLTSEVYLEQVGEDGEDQQKEKSSGGFFSVLRRGHH